MKISGMYNSTWTHCNWKMRNKIYATCWNYNVKTKTKNNSGYNSEYEDDILSAEKIMMTWFVMMTPNLVVFQKEREVMIYFWKEITANSQWHFRVLIGQKQHKDKLSTKRKTGVKK